MFSVTGMENTVQQVLLADETDFRCWISFVFYHTLQTWRGDKVHRGYNLVRMSRQHPKEIIVSYTYPTVNLSPQVLPTLSLIDNLFTTGDFSVKFSDFWSK